MLVGKYDELSPAFRKVLATCQYYCRLLRLSLIFVFTCITMNARYRKRLNAFLKLRKL